MTKNAGKPWTHDDLDELARLVTEEGLSDKETAERMGRSLHSVETQRHFQGLPINSKPGHSRVRIRAYHREKKTALGAPIHADPAMENARIDQAILDHILDVAQMFGTTTEAVIREYKRRCEYEVEPEKTLPIHVPVSWSDSSGCSSASGWLE